HDCFLMARRQAALNIPGRTRGGRREQQIVALEELPHALAVLQPAPEEPREPVRCRGPEGSDGLEQRRVDYLRRGVDGVAEPGAAAAVELSGENLALVGTDLLHHLDQRDSAAQLFARLGHARGDLRLDSRAAQRSREYHLLLTHL